MLKKASPAPEPIETPESYEAARCRAGAAGRALESGQLPLNDMLTGYRRASVLLAYCREQLDGVEAQIKVLDGETLKKWAQEIDAMSEDVTAHLSWAPGARCNCSVRKPRDGWG